MFKRFSQLLVKNKPSQASLKNALSQSILTDALYHSFYKDTLSKSPLGVPQNQFMISRPFSSQRSTGNTGHEFRKISINPEKTTKERVRRAYQRAMLRNSGPKGHRTIRIMTEFGPVTARKGRGRDPGYFITTRKQDYDNHSVGHKYSDIVDALTDGGSGKVNEADVARALLEAARGGLRPESKGVIKSPKQANAAAKLLVILHYAERLRFGGSDKMARGLLQMISENKASFAEVFTGPNPLYPMAKSPAHMHSVFNLGNKKLRKKTRPPPKLELVGAHMSDSSGEED